MREARVLIVDDEREFALTLGERLGLRGYKTKVMFSPSDLLDAIKDEQYDVILMDLYLEGSNGMDLLRRITACRSGCAVILMTGITDDRVHQDAADHGAADILIKPVDIRILVERIERALTGSVQE